MPSISLTAWHFILNPILCSSQTSPIITLWRLSRFVNAGSGVVFQRVHSVPCWPPVRVPYVTLHPSSFSLSFSPLPPSLLLMSLYHPPLPSVLSLSLHRSSCRLTQWPTKRLAYLTSPRVPCGSSQMSHGLYKRGLRLQRQNVQTF